MLLVRCPSNGEIWLEDLRAFQANSHAVVTTISELLLNPRGGTKDLFIALIARL
jgi:hypothetical protein